MRALAFCLLIASGSSAAAEDGATLARGRELTAAYLEGDTASVFAKMEPGMQRFVRGADGFAQWSAGALADLGEETEVLSETVREDVGFVIYERTSRWSKAAAPWVMRWEIAADGKVAGFAIHPKEDRDPAPTRHRDYVTKTSLRLPFDGEWVVFSGGHTAEQNVHVFQSQQRFAYDMTVARDGRRFRGSGEKLDDFHCWGVPILAPADGTVVTAVGDVPDQAVGSMDQSSLAGNHVILDVGNGEYAVLAHLREGTVRVAAGDAVKAGDELGRCGNSGNTTEPHLHFHLQNSPRLGEGEGLPAFFVDYVADGRPVAQGEPVKGQIVRAR